MVPFIGQARRRRIVTMLGVGLAALVFAASARADVRVAIAGGRVTIVATDATLAQILAEWTRVGGTAFVNAERLPAERTSLELVDVPEQVALATLLRSAAGYIVIRNTAGSATSAYARVLLLPSSSPPSSPSPRLAQVPPVPPPSPIFPLAEPDDADAGGPADLGDVAVTAGPARPPRSGATAVAPTGGPPVAVATPTAIPTPMPAAMATPAAPASTPGASIGTATPGVVVPVPPPPNPYRVVQSPSVDLDRQGQQP